MKQNNTINSIKMQNLPPNSQDPNLVQRYRSSMESIFSQVKNLLKNLLNKLTHIYTSHGINYNIKHYQSIMMKMLIPPELSSYIHFWSPACQFKDQALQALQPYQIINLKDSTFQQNNSIKDKNLIYEQQALKKEIKPKFKQSDLQKILCQKIEQNRKNGKYFSSSQIIRQGITLGIKSIQNNPKWLKHFYKKYPSVKQFILQEKIQRKYNKTSQKFNRQQENQSNQSQKLSQLAAKLKARIKRQNQEPLTKYKIEHKGNQIQDQYIKLKDPQPEYQQIKDNSDTERQVKQQYQNELVPQKRTNLKEKYMGDLYKHKGSDDQNIKQDKQQENNSNKQQDENSNQIYENEYKPVNQMSGDHQYRRSFGQKHAGLSQTNRAIRQRIKTLFFKL